MAGFVSVGESSYESFTVATGNTIYNGQFVDFTYGSTGITGALCAATPTAVPMFVQAENDTAEEQAINDVDVCYTVGKLCKAKRMLPGETFTTSLVKTADNIAVGDQCVASAGITEKTPGTGTFLQHFVCIEIYNIGDVPFYRFNVLD